MNTTGDNTTFSRSFDVSVVPGWDEDLVAHFPFNGDAIAATGNGHDRTVNGAVLATDRFDLADRAFDLDGINDSIDIGNDAALSLTTFTVSTWFKW